MSSPHLLMHIRTRSGWESVDLGFAIVRHTWKHFFPSWFLILLLLTGFMYLVFPLAYVGAVAGFLWWLKPLYDRILLHIINNSIFGRTQSSAEIISAIPKLITQTGLLGALTIYRFSPTRSFNLAIWQIEKLRGNERRERQRMLHREGYGYAFWLTLACYHIEYTVSLSVFVLVLVLDPTGTAWEGIKAIFTLETAGEHPLWMQILNPISFFLVILFLEPFYVAAGFSLYLNRRHNLEAWDTEIAFKGIGERLKNLNNGSSRTIALTLTFLFTGILTGPHPASANTLESTGNYNQITLHTQDESEIELQFRINRELLEVMKLDELSTDETVTRWGIRKEGLFNTESSYSFFEQFIELMAFIFKSILWGIALACILLMIAYRKKIAAFVSDEPSVEAQEEPMELILGLDIRPDSLPEDIVSTAQGLLKQGKPREALSLFYRASLIALIQRDSLQISVSHTEGDILRLAKPRITPKRFEYLNALTVKWQDVAYGHRELEYTFMETLLNGWGSFEQETQVDDNSL